MANSILLPKVALARSVMLIHAGVVLVVRAAAAPADDDAGVLLVLAVVISSLLLVLPNPPSQVTDVTLRNREQISAMWRWSYLRET